jgi:predicted O-methyltransferase YrrM
VSHKTTELTGPLYEYLLRVGVREAEPLRHLREETLARLPGHANMQIAPEQGALMAMLVELVGARRTLEVGVFTGYSALAVALALPRDGVVVACDVNEEWTAICRRFWEEAGVAHKIDLRLAPAIETMDALLAEGHAGSFDFAFLDAEKTEYADYYERTIELLRPGGLCTIDNVLWSGRPADPAVDDADTRAIRAFNETVHADDRVSVALVPIADGLTLARKRG